MDTLREIEDAIVRLSPSELAAFRAWFVEFDSAPREPQVKSDMNASGLGALANEAVENPLEGGGDR